ncbi:MAG TPA: proline--tRNA ligase [Actinomycetota bacterium]|nr:proline--tRNA ligase [Actinomycetota bacterium]
MRLSQLFAPTLRDDPAEAEIASHRLLLRAGFIRQITAGVYTTLPLGLRSMRKIERIVREEMDASGAQEIRMPIVLPAEPWRATGRLDLYGEAMFRLRDRHGREMVLGPTQEEVVTPLIDAELPSYRDLPVNLYQIEWKYRDEFRPRFGLLRGREFLMKDAYTFDRDEEGMARSYQVMYDAYIRIFDRLGLDYVVVEAEPGQIGGGVNHEYMARAGVGEDRFVECENGDYTADLKAATPMPPEPITREGRAKLEVVDTPGASTIEAVSTLLGCAPNQMLKTMLYDAGGRTVAVLVPGDREVEEAKLERAFFPTPVARFEDGDFEERRFAKGFVGPQGMDDDVVIVADPTVLGGADWVTGANQPDRHATGVNTPRDFRIDRFEDVLALREGDRCPKDGGTLHVGRAIVLGHIYQLHTNYSGPLGARFIDEDGSERPYQMGSYGIGISRVLAAAVEQHHDEAGLRLPRAIAPFDVVVVVANRDDERIVAESERVYEALLRSGAEALIDDREASAGVKFADADLIGYPVQVVVGKRGVEAGLVDLKLRATGERSSVPLAEAAQGTLDVLDGSP